MEPILTVGDFFHGFLDGKEPGIKEFGGVSPMEYVLIGSHHDEPGDSVADGAAAWLLKRIH